ncbi:MAG TPA: regulatory protein RecX [Actinomycetota bacterium]
MAKTPLDCHERALGLLAVRPRSRRELRTRLLRAGFEAGEVDGELERLEAVGLVDDDEFARRVAEHELSVRLSGRRAIENRLAAKGVDRATIDRALEDVGVPDEERALELARDRARRLGGLRPEQAYSRLVSFLARRGYEPGIAHSAARAALGAGTEE